ncbi:MAG: hypothetical protein IKB70_05880 [Bacilli bacterium]|nr:hypothetical protein [Bacilli bacterium]
MSVLKVKVSGQRIKYEVMKVTFDESDLEAAKGWKWEYNGNTLCFCENKLDILRDYETFDCKDVGVAIRPSSDEITYELGNSKGKMPMDNVLLCVNHRILFTYRRALGEDGLTLLDANVYDKKDTIYEYTIEIGDNELFDDSLLEIISIRYPITAEEHIVELRYDGKKMKGGADGLPFRGEPVSKKSMLTVSKKYADALGLVENWKLDKILRFEDFIKEENKIDGKKPFNKVMSVKDYNEAVKNGYVKIREDYIHSFIDEHERGIEPEEEE